MVANTADTAPRALLSDRLPNDGTINEAQLQSIMDEADANSHLVYIYKFSTLSPDESLPQHLKRLIDSGEDYAGPWRDETLTFASQAMMQLYQFPSLEATQKFMGAFSRGQGGSGQDPYWTSKSKDGRGQSGNAIHLKQFWDTITRNVLAGNFRPHKDPGLVWGTPHNPISRVLNAVCSPLILLGEGGVRHFCLLAERFPVDEEKELRMWYLRYLQTVKNTPAALTVVSNAGHILSQNSASMALYGSHGLFNRQMNIPGRPDSDEFLPLSLEYQGGKYAEEEGKTFLELLFHSSPNELKNLSSTSLQGHFTVRLETTSKILRSLCILEEGEESHHDTKISMARDPITLESIFIISQIDVTAIVKAQREVVEANEKLAKERERMQALLERQYQLIEVLKNTDLAVSGPAQDKTNGKAGSSESLGSKIASIRESLLKSGLHDPSQSTEINLQRVIGAGGFGTVYLGDWKGTKVAVKRIVLPAAMSNSERAHNMAVMEIAISSATSHPHLVQTYTYSIKPIYEQSDSTFKLTMQGESGPLINAHELRLAMEYCDRGAASDYCRSVGGLQHDYPSLLETALDITKAMHHLHSIGVTHNDMKAGNVLFKSESSGNDPRGIKAKVVDFGLSVKLGDQVSHASLGAQGTFTHSAPEVLLEGKSSKMSDVYAFVSLRIYACPH